MTMQLHRPGVIMIVFESVYTVKFDCWSEKLVRAEAEAQPAVDPRTWYRL